MNNLVRESDWDALIPLIREIEIDFKESDFSHKKELVYNIRIQIPKSMKLDVEMVRAQFYDPWYISDPTEGEMITGQFKNSTIGAYLYEKMINR